MALTRRQRVLGGLLLGVGTLTVVMLANVIETVFFAITIAYVLYPVRRWLYERGVPRGDLRLVGRDLLDGLTQQLGVFETDARDGAGDGVDCAGRVVASADSDFEDRHVDVHLTEVPERDRGQYLEVGRFVVVLAEAIDTGTDLVGVRCDLRLRDLTPVDANLLAEVVQPRRGE